MIETIKLTGGLNELDRLKIVIWIFPVHCVLFLVSLFEGRYRGQQYLLFKSIDQPGYPWIQDSPVLGNHFFGDFIDTFETQRQIASGGYFGLYSVILKLLEGFSYKQAFFVYLSFICMIIAASSYQVKLAVSEHLTSSVGMNSARTILILSFAFALLSYPMIFAFDRGNGSLLIGAGLICGAVILIRKKSQTASKGLDFGEGFFERLRHGLTHLAAPIILGLIASVKLTPILLTTVFVLITLRSFRAFFVHLMSFLLAIFLQINLLQNVTSITYPFSGSNVTDLDGYRSLTSGWSSGLDVLELSLSYLIWGREASYTSTKLTFFVLGLLAVVVLHALFLALKHGNGPSEMVAIVGAAALSHQISPSGGLYNNVVYLIPFLGFVGGLFSGRNSPKGFLLWLLSIMMLLPFRVGIIVLDFGGTEITIVASTVLMVGVQPVMLILIHASEVIIRARRHRELRSHHADT